MWFFYHFVVIYDFELYYIFRLLSKREFYNEYCSKISYSCGCSSFSKNPSKRFIFVIGLANRNRLTFKSIPHWLTKRSCSSVSTPSYALHPPFHGKFLYVLLTIIADFLLYSLAAQSGFCPGTPYQGHGLNRYNIGILFFRNHPAPMHTFFTTYALQAH